MELNQLEQEFFEKILEMSVKEAQEVANFHGYTIEQYFNQTIKLAKAAASLCREREKESFEAGFKKGLLENNKSTQ